MAEGERPRPSDTPLHVDEVDEQNTSQHTAMQANAIDAAVPVVVRPNDDDDSNNQSAARFDPVSFSSF